MSHEKRPLQSIHGYPSHLFPFPKKLPPKHNLEYKSDRSQVINVNNIKPDIPNIEEQHKTYTVIVHNDNDSKKSSKYSASIVGGEAKKNKTHYYILM